MGLSARQESTDDLSAKLELTDRLSARRNLTDGLFARRELPTCTAQTQTPQIQLLSSRKGGWLDYAIPGGHRMQHQSGEQADF